MEPFSDRKKLEDFFQVYKNPLRLNEMYILLRLVTRVLHEPRWVKYAKKSGEFFTETTLEHLFDKIVIGAEMIAIEKAHGGPTALALNTSKIYLAFALHGLGVALHGDVALMDRTPEDIKKEDDSFERLLARLPDPVYRGLTHTYLRDAYSISKEREKAFIENRDLSSLSVNGRFLWSVVIVTFFAKALCESRFGNVAFVNTIHNMWNDMEHMMKEFISFRTLMEPILDEAKLFKRENPYWEE